MSMMTEPPTYATPAPARYEQADRRCTAPCWLSRKVGERSDFRRNRLGQVARVAQTALHHLRGDITAPRLLLILLLPGHKR